MFFVGGFIGSIRETQVDVNISQCINKGFITGEDSIGGFIGSVLSIDSTPVNLFVADNINKGNVTATSGKGCGMFCISQQSIQNINSTVLNSINKGLVKANANGYGISDNVTKARNVVSIGELVEPVSSTESYTFWKSSEDVDLLYGLNDKCIRCSSDIKMLEYNITTGFFHLVESGEFVHDLLNLESVKHDYKMAWTSQLDLAVEVVVFNVTGEFCQYFVVGTGTKCKSIGNLSYYFSPEYGVVSYDSGTRVVHKATDIILRNVTVLIGKKVMVTIGEPINTKKYMVVGETMEQVAHFFGFSFDDYVVKDGSVKEIVNKLSTL